MNIGAAHLKKLSLWMNFDGVGHLYEKILISVFQQNPFIFASAVVITIMCIKGYIYVSEKYLLKK